MEIKIAAEFEQYGDTIKKIVPDWVKKYSGQVFGEYLINKLALEILKDKGDEKDNRLLDKMKKALREEFLPAFGAKVGRGMHATDSEELVFASEAEALQRLADLTGKKIMVANDDLAESLEELRDELSGNVDHFVTSAKNEGWDDEKALEGAKAALRSIADEL